MRSLLLGLGAATSLLLATTASAGVVRASSEYVDDEGTRHSAALAVDGLLSTGWAEGEVGTGAGSWLELKLDRPMEVQSISVWPGNLTKGTRSLKEHSRPRTLTVLLVGGSGGEDVVREVRVPDGAEVGPQRVDVPIHGSTAVVRITIDDTYGGFLHNETYIAEVAVNFTGGGVPPAVAASKTWLESTRGQAGAEQSAEEIVELFGQIESSQFGDRDAMQEIMARASDGSPFLRTYVTRSIPMGFRVQGLPPDDVAVKALLKLKDPNGIPAIHLAALRSTGTMERELLRRVEYFEAFADLKGGGNRNIPVWGQTGWERGALRGFGEPLPLVVDQWGALYVCDVGNHRIQKFNEHGVSTGIFGGEPSITDHWFDGRRAFYVAGSEPGTDPVRFRTPVAIERIDGKNNDQLAVLDTDGRVQILSDDGALVHEWKVRGQGPISAGVGAEGHLQWMGNRLAVIWGNEVFVRDLTGEEEYGKFRMEDGVPQGTIALPGGKLGLIFGRDIVTYSLDGYRHQGILGEELGGGFEAWDVTVDGKGKLWVVTDDGWVTKYKRPGKVDFRIRIADYSFEVPRLAVKDDVVYVTTGDKILRVDALEVLARAALADVAEEDAQ